MDNNFLFHLRITIVFIVLFLSDISTDIYALPPFVDPYQEFSTELQDVEICAKSKINETLEIITNLAASNEEVTVIDGGALVTLSLKDKIGILSVQRINSAATDIIWDGTKFVAITVSGNILIKENSNEWRVIATNMYSRIRSFQQIIFHKGIYYAVGYNAMVLNIPGVDGEGFIFYSENLEHWNEIPINNRLFMIDSSNWSNGEQLIISSREFRQIIVIDDPQQVEILDHDDGREKTYYPPFVDITSNGSDYILLGYDGREGFIGKSKDGKNWYGRNEQEWVTLQSLAWGEPGYIAVGMKGKIYHSLVGEVWEEVESGTDLHLLDVIWVDDSYIAVGGDFIDNDLSLKNLSSKSRGIIFTSKDGRKWERVKCIR